MCVSGTNTSRDECSQKAHCSVEEAGAGPPRSLEANVPDELVVLGSLPGTALSGPQTAPGSARLHRRRRQRRVIARLPVLSHCQDELGAFCSQIISAGDP